MTTRMIDVITKDAIKFFNLDEESVFFLKTDFAAQYLAQHFPHDAEIIETMLQHAAFWLWWRELWAVRDKKLITMCERKQFWINYQFPIGKEVKLANGDSFIPKSAVLIPWDEVWHFYKKYHSPERIKFYPNYVLIHNCKTLSKVEQ